MLKTHINGAKIAHGSKSGLSYWFPPFGRFHPCYLHMFTNQLITEPEWAALLVTQTTDKNFSNRAYLTAEIFFYNSREVLLTVYIVWGSMYSVNSRLENDSLTRCTLPQLSPYFNGRGCMQLVRHWPRAPENTDSKIQGRHLFAVLTINNLCLTNCQTRSIKRS